MYKKRIHIFLIFMFTASICFAQSNTLSQLINYTAHQKTIGEILQDLENITNTNFTYNSALIDISEKVSVSVNNKKLEDILIILFLQKFTYKQIGSQILITPNTTPIGPPAEPAPTIKQNNKQGKKPPPIQDTIKIFDTIQHTLYDTITRIVYDTIHVIDSSDFYLSKQISQRAHTPTVTISTLWGAQHVHSFFWNKKKNSYTQDLQNTKNKSSAILQGIYITQQFSKTTCGIGLQNVHFTETIDFSTSLTTDNDADVYIDSLWFWQYNVIFSYYKFIPGGDSVLIPVYDSVYTYRLVENPKKVVTNTRYSSTNSYRYIGIPLSYGLRHFFSKSIEIQSSIVLNPLIRIYQYGLYPNKDKTNIVDLKDIGLRRITFAVGLTWNVMWHLNKNYSIHIKPSCFSIPVFTKKAISGFQKSHLAFGIEWGVSYSFPYTIYNF